MRADSTPLWSGGSHQLDASFLSREPPLASAQMSPSPTFNLGGSVSERSSPKLSLSPSGPISKGTVTRYRCGFPGCNKRYASTDGVRKHARKTHMAWLKSIDETAGARDRQTESKPSTYCTMEVVDASEAGDLEPSPVMLPTKMAAGDMPGLSLDARELFSLPFPQDAQAARAAADGLPPLGGAAEPAVALPPNPHQLAWLLMQQGVSAHAAAVAAYASLAASARTPTAHAVPHTDGSLRTDLPLAFGTLHQPPPLSAMSPAMMLGVPNTAAPAAATAAAQPTWHAQGEASLGTTTPSLLGALPSPGSWGTDLLSLFASATDEGLPGPGHGEYDWRGTAGAECQGFGGTQAPSADEDAASHYLSPPMMTQMADLCVSPFELEKRPKPFVPTAEATTITVPLELPPSCASFSDVDDRVADVVDDLEPLPPIMKEAEEALFAEALLSF